MKIVIFSDSHGDTNTMCYVVEKEKPDMIIYLGDGISDAEELNAKYPNTKMIKILGGIDSDKEDEEWIKVVEICEKRFVLTHGHKLIRYTFNNDSKAYMQTEEDRIQSHIALLECINEHDADILLHGHTHEPYMNRIGLTPKKTCWIMNPGRIGRQSCSDFSSVYGILRFDESNAFEWTLKEVNA